MEDEVAVQATAVDTSGVVSRALDLLSDHVLTLIALGLVGSLFGIATMYAVKLFIPPLDDAPHKEAMERKLFLTRCAFVSGFLWTLIIVGVYTSNTIAPGALVAGTVAIGIAMLSGAATPLVFKLAKAGWLWLWTWVRKKLGRDGDGPDDNNDGDITELRGSKKK